MGNGASVSVAGSLSVSPVDLTELTAMIVSAYVGNNSVPAEKLAELMISVNEVLAHLPYPTRPRLSAPSSTVDTKDSVHPNYIVCLEDKKRFKSLKRHLATHHGLTPEEYREKWGLPDDYPMVAPNYGSRRSEIAKEMGLGHKSGRKR